MGRRPKEISISKIAREAGVAESTVSRALNHRAMVSEDTRKKINSLMRKYKFKLTPAIPIAKKIALVSGNNNFNSYISEVFTGIYEYTQQYDLNTTIIFKNVNAKQSLLDQIREQQCSGVIIIVPTAFRDDFDALADSDIPVILIDEAVHKNGLGFIDHDSYSGSREAAKHLLQNGHRNIGYIRCGYKTLNHLQRFKAYENTMKETNIEINPNWIIETDTDSSLIESSYVKMRVLLERSPEITAVMTSNDEIAMGAMKAALEMGRNIPENLSLIGFDNYPYTRFLSPALTTVNHPAKEAGFLAVKNIHEFLSDTEKRTLCQEILPTRLVIRDSTAIASKLKNIGHCVKKK